MKYEGRFTQAISFPVGGIGTGSIGIAGNGRLIDWEIRNRPDKCSGNGFSFFTVKAEKDGKLISAKILNGDLPSPYQGMPTNARFSGYGFGPERCTMAGVPHFRDHVFDGSFPFAKVSFSDDSFPGIASIEVFNPMIPSNADDSGIPAAFFTIELLNDTSDTIDYTIAGCLSNMFGKSINRAEKINNGTLVFETYEDPDEQSPEYGNLAIATDCSDSSLQEYWFRGSWFDSLSVFWQNFCAEGPLKPRTYDTSGDHDTAAISSHIRLKAGDTAKVRFLISWYFPNFTHYWNPLKPEEETDTLRNTWKNYYATLFSSAKDVAEYSLSNWDRLEYETRRFHDTLASSTLPEYVLDAVMSTMSVLKTPTCIRLTDGTFYGWEGLHTRSGSCEGTCTHVWNYAYALPYLFPALERTIRESNYKYNQDDIGGMHFRTQLPLGRAYSSFRPCADGQFGDVMKAYREWKICGDTDWLRRLWPSIRKSVEYAWHPDNPDMWDLNADGVLEGRQHHTLDMELFGPSGWLNGFYLGALKAAAEMALALEDTESAEKFIHIYQNGRKWADENLFNGEYYIHRIDITDHELLKPYGDEAYINYWNDEAKEIKYQIGEGCSIDQVTAQWHACNIGLGEILDPSHVKTALESIYKYNYMSMRDHFNPCRLYSLNDEKGTVMCEWPGKACKPVIPVPYAEETMYGFEYQAAVSMLQNDLVPEGLELIRSIRMRHNGENRNPWNEMECGSNYARSMAAYSALIALSGFVADLTQSYIGFAPKINNNDFRCFWAVDNAWGSYRQTKHTRELKVLYGSLQLQEFGCPLNCTPVLRLNGYTIGSRIEKDKLSFDRIVLTKDDTLSVEL